MEKIKEKLTDKKVLMPVLVVALILLLIEGLTYAWLVWRGNGDEIQRIKGGTLELELDDLTSKGIDLDQAIPMSDTQGKATRAYTFTVRNKGTLNASYILYLEDEDLGEGQTRLEDQYIKYSITKNNSSENALELTSSINGDSKREIQNSIINAGGVDSYTLKIWIKGNATNEQIANKVFKARIKLEAEQTTETNNEVAILEGAGQTVQKGNTARFRTDEEYSNFEDGGKVLVDGREISSDNYTSESGSTVITLTKDYIKSLSIGSHTLKVQFKDGKEATTTFTVEEQTYKYTNSHIEAAYKYDEDNTSSTFCLGGEEAGCEQISLTSSTSVPAGTIVKYEVASGVEKYFNVIKDNGTTLTMQQRENTVASKAWYSSGSNSNGPSTDSGYVLGALESATSSWTYVDDQPYSIGDDETTLGYSGCKNYTNCSESKYSLSRTAKARMITIQELATLNCTENEKSCKKFVNNYLAGSKSNGGSFETDTDSYYWTMSAYTSFNDQAWFVRSDGLLSHYTVNIAYYGARAVIEVDK